MSMKAEEVIRYLLEESDGLDFLGESLTWVARRTSPARLSRSSRKATRSLRTLRLRGRPRSAMMRRMIGEMELMHEVCVESGAAAGKVPEFG